MKGKNRQGSLPFIRKLRGGGERGIRSSLRLSLQEEREQGGQNINSKNEKEGDEDTVPIYKQTHLRCDITGPKT